VANVGEVFALAAQYQQAGNLAQAEQLCRQILQADPGHVNAHHMLGVILHRQGRAEAATIHYQQVLRLQPNSAEPHNNLGIALTELGRLDEAVACYHDAIRINPLFAEAHNGLGYALERQHQLEEAIRCYRQALRLKADFAEAWYNLGNALKQQGNVDEAVRCFQQALQLRPDYADANNNLGNVLAEQQQLRAAASCYEQVLRLRPHDAAAHRNLGIVLDKQGKTEEALVHFQQSVRLKPDDAKAHNNLGTALWTLGQLEQAVQAFRRTVQLRPDYAEAHNNLGTALGDLGKLEEATGCFQRAVGLKPDYAEAHSNVGMALWAKEQVDEALACFERALRLKPDDANARLSRAQLWLQSGEFEQGWQEYEWRWTQPWTHRKGSTPGKRGDRPDSERLRSHPDLARRPFSQPLWDGSNLHGSSILVHAEQGLGDTLQFIRYVQLVKERGGKVIVEYQAPLLRLLEGCPGIDRLVAQGAPLPAFDVQVPLLSLPAIFHTSIDTIPATIPYLHADVNLVEQWRRELEQSRKSEVGSPMSEEMHLTSDIGLRTSDFLVGIAWQGNPTYHRDRQRAIPLTHFGRLAQVEGVQLISLQKGPGTEQLCTLAGRFGVLDLGSKLDEGAGPFKDTAAVMKNLDLVISSDTAVPHLAGALGVPVWVVLPLVPDWRWLLGREDSPWYPTMRLFRQTRYGCWEEVFERIAKELDRCKR